MNTVDKDERGLLRVEHIMGMPIIIDVRDPAIEPYQLDDIFAWFREVDETFSTYKQSSEITRINLGLESRTEASAVVREVLDRCDELCDETAGFFDIHAAGRMLGADGTVNGGPDSIDPSGFVKGWSVNRAVRLMSAAGIDHYCINAGGDMIVRGFARPMAYWDIGIQHPYIPDKLAGVVRCNDLAIATSGLYERGGHIIAPETGLTPVDVLSVTITGQDLGTADAYATAAFAMGAAGPAWTARLVDYEAMTILSDETVLKTAGFPSLPPT